MKISILLALGCAVAIPADGQVQTGMQSNDFHRRMELLNYVPPAYKEATIRAIADEAGEVAKELDLEEPLPITISNVISAYVSPPRLAQAMGTVGNITTSNYIYYASEGGKLSFVEQLHKNDKLKPVIGGNLSSSNTVDDQNAYSVATNILARARIDVNALNRDCNPRIACKISEEQTNKQDMPVYSVHWMSKNPSVFGSVAEVEFVLPKLSIRELRVQNPKYILRHSLLATNLASLQTNTSKPLSLTLKTDTALSMPSASGSR